MLKIVNLKNPTSDLRELNGYQHFIRNAALSVLIGFSFVTESAESDLVESEAEDKWRTVYVYDVRVLLDTIGRYIIFNPEYVENAAKNVYIKRVTMGKECYRQGINYILTSQLSETKNQGFSETAEAAYAAYYDSVCKILNDKATCAKIRFSRTDVKVSDLDVFIEGTIPKDSTEKYFDVFTWRRMIFEYFDICSWIFNINTKVEYWHKCVTLKNFLPVLYPGRIIEKFIEDNKTIVEPLADILTNYYCGESTVVDRVVPDYLENNIPVDMEIY